MMSSPYRQPPLITCKMRAEVCVSLTSSLIKAPCLEIVHESIVEIYIGCYTRVVRGKLAMLEARDLTKSYSGIPAVNNVSFQIERGEVLGYLGPNGSGKSTTVKMLTGLMDPDRGHVLLDGEDIRRDLAR